MTDSFQVGFDDDGALRQRGRDGWREPVCPECGDPIRWVLDMASFRHDGGRGYVMCHARCVWTPEAFRREARRATGC